MAKAIQLLTLEEHFTSDAAAKLYGNPEDEFGPRIGPQLAFKELSDSRLKDMSSNGVARQVLSHTPFKTAPDPKLCASINDELGGVIKHYPKQYAGFASLPMEDAKASAEELRRTVSHLGFVGALIDAHTDGIWYDGPEYDQVWGVAQELDVPIYIHPCYASEDMLRVNFRGNYDESVAMGLGAWIFGWHVATGLEVLRMFASGVFDRFPRLKIVIGHMGETLPFMLRRQEGGTSRWTHLKRPLAEVWRENIWVTTSGMFDTAPLELLLKMCPRDHVLLSIDFPFSANEQGREFVEEIEKQGLLTGDELEAFAYGNAAKLLRL